MDFVVKPIALMYAYLFFTGWAYMVALYRQFNIDVWTLDLPTYTYPVSSIFAFMPIGVKTILLLSIIAVLVAPFSRFILGEAAWSRLSNLRNYLIVPALLGTFPFLALIGFWTGSHAGQDAWESRPHVHLTFKVADRQPYEPELLKANDERRLLILTETKDIVVVFEAKKANDIPLDIRALQGRPPKKENVFVLARADLAAVHIGP